MFGYVRPALNLLPREERDRYQSAYCGLCHAMGARHGFFARFTLNYDFAFLAILFAREEEETRCRRCPAHPLRKGRSCACGSGMNAAADASMILTWHKLRDDVLDKGPVKSLPARLLCLFFARAYRRAKAALPGFARQVEESLEELHRLEALRSGQLDRVADTFARILTAAAPACGDEARRRVLEQMLYHVGRWIYLVDAWDDLVDDRLHGRYNPLDARFDGHAEEQREYLSTSMTHSLRLAVSAGNLTGFGVWTAVVQHILYTALPTVQEGVLSGRWAELKRKKYTEEKR